MAAAAKEEKLEMLLLGQPVSDRTRATVLQQFQDQTAAAAGGEEIFRSGRTTSEPMAARC